MITSIFHRRLCCKLGNRLCGESAGQVACAGRSGADQDGDCEHVGSAICVADRGVGENHVAAYPKGSRKCAEAFIYECSLLINPTFEGVLYSFTSVSMPAAYAASRTVYRYRPGRYRYVLYETRNGCRYLHCFFYVSPDSTSPPAHQENAALTLEALTHDLCPVARYPLPT